MSESDLTSAFSKTGRGHPRSRRGTPATPAPRIVIAGTVLVNSNYGSSDFEVASGATLGGLGSVGNLTVADGGTLSPGNSPDALSSQDLSLATGVDLRRRGRPATSST